MEAPPTRPTRAPNDISIVDLAGGHVMATIAVGNAPRKIAVQPRPAGKGAGAPTAVAAAAPAGRSIKLGSLTFSDHGTKDAKGQTEVEVEADDYYFKPTFLRGVPGQKLRLEVENESGALHNISITGQRIDKDISPKGKVEVDVVFPASGVVHFHCKFHSALGMNGQLLAGDAAPQPLSRHPDAAVASPHGRASITTAVP
jgi:plastocyanin